MICHINYLSKICGVEKPLDTHKNDELKHTDRNYKRGRDELAKRGRRCAVVQV